MDKFSGMLSEYVDGALPDTECRAVERHLKECPSCAGAAEEMRSLSRFLKAAPRQPLPAGFLQRLQRRREEPAPSLFAPGLLRPAGFAFAGALGVLIVGEFWNRGSSTLESVTLTAALAPDAPQETPSQPLKKARGQALAEFKGVRAAANAGSGAVAAKAEAPQPTNEDLYEDLRVQQKSMGIRRILPPEPSGFAGLGAAGGGEGSVVMARSFESARVGGSRAALLAAPAAGGAALDPRALDMESVELKNGLVLRTQSEVEAAWKRFGLKTARPEVDFSREMVVLVLSGGAQIAGVNAANGRLLVTYRDREGSPYPFRVVPLSNLPAEFEKAP